MLKKLSRDMGGHLFCILKVEPEVEIEKALKTIAWANTHTGDFICSELYFAADPLEKLLGPQKVWRSSSVKTEDEIE